MGDSRNAEEFEHRCALSWLCRLMLSVAVSRCVLYWAVKSAALRSSELPECRKQATKSTGAAEMQVITCCSRAAVLSHVLACAQLQPRLSGMPSVLQAASLPELCGFIQCS